MKNILITVFLTFTFLSCKAQSPIVSLDANRSSTPDGAYFKDLNNELNKFVGTWLFTNGNTSLTIILKKKEMYFNGKDYQDVIFGEYKFIDNGIEVVNTLPNINNSNSAKHKIYGRRIVKDKNRFVKCDSCLDDERRIMLGFTDSERIYLSASIMLRYLEGNNPNKINATIYSNHGVMLPNENSPTETRVPYGEYLMEKQ